MLAWASAVLLPLAQGTLIPKTQVSPGDYYGKKFAFYDAVVDQCYYMEIGTSFIQRLPIPTKAGLQPPRGASELQARLGATMNLRA